MKNPARDPVHWIFKDMDPIIERDLCRVPDEELHTEHSIVLRPVRKRPGGPLNQCPNCAKVGKALGIP